MIHPANLLDYLRAKGYIVDTAPGELNIVYIEGMNPDGTLNPDTLDRWNDLRLVIDHDTAGQAKIICNHVATTEPGREATFSQSAGRRGGVARIAFGQYKAWQMGFHKQDKNGKNHPALVQRAPVSVHRDKNRNGIRDKSDNIHVGMFGINQHGTRPGYRGQMVGMFSEGCLVGFDWDMHIAFIQEVKKDVRYQKDQNHMFLTTIIAGDDLNKWIIDNKKGNN